MNPYENEYIRSGERVLAAEAVMAHPLGAPTISGTTITVDVALNQPTRITRMVMDLTLQRFLADRVFASGGGVTGGAVIYDEIVENELYTNRDVERVAPGGSFPLVTWERRMPKVAEVEKWGGKVFITDEAKDRNNTTEFANGIRRLSNTIVRKINQRCIEVLEASITANAQSITGNNWATVTTAGTSASSASLYPARDFGRVQMLADEDELGIVIDLWILNPQEYLQLATLYGADLEALLASMGIDIYVSNRVTPGTAYAVAEKQVGEMRIEKALGTETWRDPDHERTFVQSSVRPVMFVNNPFAVFKVTGLAG